MAKSDLRPTASHSHHLTMPDGGVTVLDDLPDSIVVEEILVRLPPKDLLRCRAVRKYWRSATSTDKFMLDHRRRQPLLLILSQGFSHVDQWSARLFVSRDAGAGQQKLCPVLIRSVYGTFYAALDGLLIVSEGDEYFICNPVTRKCAPLPMPQIHEEFTDRIAAFFRHQPSGEYRVLWVTSPAYCDPNDTDFTTSYCVIAVGSGNPQPRIPQPAVSSPSLEVVLRTGLPSSSSDPPVHHNGSLHWKLGTPSIVVFNTTAEMFRLMSSPAPPAKLRTEELLLEMDGTLAFCRISGKRDTIDVWAMQDYDAEIWSSKHRINLSVVDCFDSARTMFPKMSVLSEGELLIQFSLRSVLCYDIDGKFLGYVKSEEDQKLYLQITRHYLQESVIPLPLFHETREEAEPPFFPGL
ncbi:unnamed protein product [Alopecurus aequalis]